MAKTAVAARRPRGHVPVRASKAIPSPAVAAVVAPVETVASLLAGSRAAHARYRQLDTQTPGQASPAMREAAREAWLLRTQAEALDRLHTDTSAWADDAVQMRAPSNDLVAFYVRLYKAGRVA